MGLLRIVSLLLRLFKRPGNNICRADCIWVGNSMITAMVYTRWIAARFSDERSWADASVEWS